ncbi:hypothetical protein ES703_118834 [subsurface metagenome]
MGLHLEAQRPLPVKINHPGIIHKDRKAPRLAELIGCPGDGALQQVINDFPVIVNPAPECLVDAVLRPGLRQCLQLNVGGVPSLLLKVAQDSLELIIGKPEAPGDLRLTRPQNIQLLQTEAILGILREAEQFLLDDVLDNGVDQQPTADEPQLLLVQLPFNKVPFPGSDGTDIA